MTEEIFNFVKKHHPKTRLIVSGVRTREDALAVAGADYILAPAAVVEELRSMGTTAGYNDGLSGVSSGGGVVRRLDPEAAQAVEFGKEKTKTVTEAAFKAALEKGVCGEWKAMAASRILRETGGVR